MSQHTLLIATRNAHKRREFEGLIHEAFDAIAWRLIDVASFGAPLPEVDEDRDSFEGNAIKKALELSRAAGLCAISEDSGLEVDALDGAPGVRSARFAGEGARDADNNALLLERMAHVPAPHRTARFVAVCCVAIAPDAAGHALLERLGARWDALPEGEPELEGMLGRVGDRAVLWLRGAVEGELVEMARGEDGFGYDPLFLIPRWGLTFGEVDAARKAQVSHRAMALRKLAAALSSQG